MPEVRQLEESSSDSVLLPRQTRLANGAFWQVRYIAFTRAHLSACIHVAKLTPPSMETPTDTGNGAGTSRPHRIVFAERENVPEDL